MTSAHDIDLEFRERALSRGGLQLFRPADAIDLIRRCRDAGVRVLGIDAFLELHDMVQPSMEHSIDFTTEEHVALVENSWYHGERFIRARVETPLLFEVVIERPDSFLNEEV
jgi:hypothetical protein